MLLVIKILTIFITSQSKRSPTANPSDSSGLLAPTNSSSDIVVDGTLSQLKFNFSGTLYI